MLHNFTVDEGDARLAVATSEKTLAFEGDGVARHDRIKFIDVGAASAAKRRWSNAGGFSAQDESMVITDADCANSSLTLYVAGASNNDDPSADDFGALSLGKDLDAAIQFGSSAVGARAGVCYGFGADDKAGSDTDRAGEPWRYYGPPRATQFDTALAPAAALSARARALRGPAAAGLHLDVLGLGALGSRTGSPRYAVAGVPELLTFAGMGVSTRDTVAWVASTDVADCSDAASRVPFVDEYARWFNFSYSDDDASDGNTTTVNATQTGSESSEPSQRPFVVTSVVPRSNDTTTTATSINSTQAATSVTVMFNSTQAGATARLCYQFRNETWVLYTAETTKVSELTSYAASGGGDDDTAVANDAKTWRFGGAHLAEGDTARWVKAREGDDRHVADSGHCGSNRTAPLSEADDDGDDTTDGEDRRGVVTIGAGKTASFEFASAAASHGKLTLCYSFGGVEPWRRYALASLRVVELRSVTVDAGETDVAVAGADKTFSFGGPGVASGDGIYWIPIGTSDGCSSSKAPLVDADTRELDKDKSALVEFQQAAATDIPYQLCYVHLNEPAHLYDSFDLSVKAVVSVSVVVAEEGTNGGSAELLVVGVSKTLAFTGEGVSSGDIAAWVPDAALGPDGGSSAECAAAVEAWSALMMTTDGNGQATFKLDAGDLTDAVYLGWHEAGDSSGIGGDAATGLTEVLSLRLCYKFGDEPWAAVVGAHAESRALAGVVARPGFGSNDTAVVGDTKAFAARGAGVGTSDIAVWVTDARCDGGAAYYGGGLVNTVQATAAGGDDNSARVAVTFTSPTPESNRATLTLCWGFGGAGGEPLAAFPAAALPLAVVQLADARLVLGSVSFDDDASKPPMRAIIGAGLVVQLLGFGIGVGDTAKYVDTSKAALNALPAGSSRCDQEAGGGSERAAVSNADQLTFKFGGGDYASATIPPNVALCYAHGAEPWHDYGDATGGWGALEVIAPSISFANTSATVAGVAEGLRLVGTFGATFGDVIKFVDASATVCDADAALASLTASDGTQSPSLNVDGTAAYDDNDAALSIDALFAALALEAAARGGAGEIAFATAEPGLSATTGSASVGLLFSERSPGPEDDASAAAGGASQFTAAMAWRLCARFGDATTGVWYGPSADLRMAAYGISSVSTDASALAIGSPAVFSFTGTGIADADLAKFVDAAVVSSSAACAGASGVAGSVVGSVADGATTFTFTSAVDAFALCYKFGAEPWVFYASDALGLTATTGEASGGGDSDTASALGGEGALVQAAVTMRLDLSFDTIPPGSPARKRFEGSFVSNLAGALGISAKRLAVTAITAGSVIVDFVIYPSASGADVTVSELVSSVREQLDDPNSALRTGNVTGAATGELLVAFEAASVTAAPEGAEALATLSSAAAAPALLPYQHGGLFAFEASYYPTTEASGVVSLTVRRAQGALGKVTLRWATADGTASAASDFVGGTGGLIHFASGETIATIKITLLDDQVAEPHFELFYVTIELESFELANAASMGVSAAVGTPSYTTVIEYDWADATPLLGYAFEGAHAAALSGMAQPLPANESASVITLNGVGSWSVVGNGEAAATPGGAGAPWVDAHGLGAADMVHGAAEYDEACDLAAPWTPPCEHDCVFGGAFALAPDGDGAGNGAAVLALSGDTAHVAAAAPLVDGDDANGGAAAFPSDELTISMWVRFPSSEAASASTVDTASLALVSYEVANAAEPYHELLLSSPRDLTLSLRSPIGRGLRLGGLDLVSLTTGGAATKDDDSSYGSKGGAWHHLAVAWRSIDGRVVAWLDGARVFVGGPYRAQTTLRAGGALVVGGAQAAGTPCRGAGGVAVANAACVTTGTALGGGALGGVELQNVRVWSRALFESEDVAAELRWPFAPASLSGLFFDWRFVPETLSSADAVLGALGPRAVADGAPGGSRPAVLSAAGGGAELVLGGTPTLAGLGRFPCGEVYAPSSIWHFAAPAALAAALSDAYGGRLQFRLRAPSASGAVRSSRGAIRVVGGGALSDVVLSYRSVFGAPTDGSWTYVSAVLREDFGWAFEPSGVVPTADEMIAVFANASALELRGDAFVYGASGSGQEVVYVNDVAVYPPAA